MDVRTLYTLIAIADYRSFAEASRAVGLSASAVSLQMKALEEETGVPLFDRSVRPPRLTSHGLLFVERARRVVAEWERLSETLTSDAVTGVLELGAVPTVVAGCLPGALRRLRDRHPELRVQLTTALSHELEEMMQRGSLDAAVLVQPQQVPAGLTWATFETEILCVIAPVETPGDGDIELLRSAPYIRYRRQAWVARLIEQEFARRGIRLKPAMEIDSLDGVLSLVAEGLGVSVVPRRNVANPFPPGLRSVPFGSPPVTRNLGILSRPDNPRARFVGELLAELATPRGLVAGPISGSDVAGGDASGSDEAVVGDVGGETVGPRRGAQS